MAPPPIICPMPDYAQTFQSDLAPEVLVTLINLHKDTVHPSDRTLNTAPTPKPEKVRRPTISAAGSSEDWAYFLNRWDDYKRATHLRDNDISYQLYVF